GNATDTLLQVASSLQKNYPNLTFQFYSGDATDVTERLDHGTLDFAILLQPIDNSKYEHLPLPEASIWGILMKKESEFSQLPAITKENLLQMPLILHRRVGLQQNIADWANTDIEHLHINATYNVVHGSPVSFVKNNMGYFLLTRDLLSPDLDKSVVFRPLEPQLKVQYNIVWKRRNVFSNAAKLFLETVKQVVNYNLS
ncbi:MAG: LysR family transcriptional regulator substrate-binding protein, partial [Lachnospiraceae bacterium]|nr:LysR family transcriptional regulator substrate-binding protein [Lachnospiraceae bacterium]